MKFHAAWTRGLAYGGICAGVMAAIPAVISVVLLVIGHDWRQTMLAAAVNSGIWGAIGFLLGFFSHRDLSTDVVAGSIASTKASIVKQWLYRILAGFLLANGAAAVVELMMVGFVVLIYGSLDVHLNHKPNRDGMKLEFFGMSAMMGGAAGAALGAFFGVMLAPMRYESRAILRSSVMAAGAGAMAGAWIGGPVSLLHPHIISLGWSAILAAVASAVAGIMAAILLRLFVNR